MFYDRSHHSCAVCMLAFVPPPIIIILQHSVLFVLVVLYVKLQLLSLPSLFPILAAAGLFCTTPQVQVAIPPTQLLLLLVMKVGA